MGRGIGGGGGELRGGIAYWAYTIYTRMFLSADWWLFLTLNTLDQDLYFGLWETTVNNDHIL